jgi:LysM repeat protein
MTCPFLGMPGDAKTSLAFPSAWNYCHHCKPVASVSLAHQRSHCLTGEYEACPVFLQSLNDALPHNLRGKSARPVKKKTPWVIVFLFPTLLAVIFFGWHFLTRDVAFAPAFPEISSPTASLLPVSSTITSSPQQANPLTIFTPFSLPTPNATHISRVTPISTRRPHTIDDLIGRYYMFKIHRVQQIEDIEGLARSNSTTVAVVMELNYKLQTPLWPGQLVLLPLNQRDVSLLPQFEIYRVMEDITTDELASKLNADAAQLRYYNGLEPKEEFLMKEWIIIPREKTRKPHAMDEFAGVDFIFKIHRVRQGESMKGLAFANNITVAALTAVNYKLDTSLWSGQVIVIPGSQMDVSGLPQFETYYVTENITTELLAAQLNVDPTRLRYFNGLGPNEHFVKNEWIIVPQEKTK